MCARPRESGRRKTLAGVALTLYPFGLASRWGMRFEPLIMTLMPCAFSRVGVTSSLDAGLFYVIFFTTRRDRYYPTFTIVLAILQQVVVCEQRRHLDSYVCLCSKLQRWARQRRGHSRTPPWPFKRTSCLARRTDCTPHPWRASTLEGGVSGILISV